MTSLKAICQTNAGRGREEGKREKDLGGRGEVGKASKWGR